MIPISVDAVETVDELQGKKLQNMGQFVEILVSVVSVVVNVVGVVSGLMHSHVLQKSFQPSLWGGQQSPPS